jgi:hypothetical protein
MAHCSQLFFYLQHPIIETPPSDHALHLVHRGQLVIYDHNIYPARKVPLL